MHTNILEIVIVIILALAILIWLVMRNRKDEESFEKDALDDKEFVERHDPDKE
ncbi:hypothetical protein GWR56_05435 [Mucilaginibacter sp. 14171R-50]|uniref:hypothetical protein n=1 Tax=Mucilaginibacter sp. 14171R-50 TaxID=2703789 RepID=UPI00138C61B0|nr:hypothetical protein [Mucilaginibacter sp. 14171R-50]QHS55007.1 hypothetical protein GWR56_05435 [Mucilaginibacter sp. 14171R-50]